MPKRTNDFQELISCIEQNLSSENAQLEESKILVDKVTGANREVDIYLEVKERSGRTYRVAIEVVDRSRKQSVEWIERMHSKLSTLPVDKKILVSRKGFTSTAIEKGQFYNFDLLTFEDARKVNWKKIFLSDFSISKCKLEPVATEIITNEEHPEIHEYIMQHPNRDQLVLRNSNGKEEKISTIRNQALSNPSTHQKIMEIGNENMPIRINITDFANSNLITDEGNIYPIKQVIVEAKYTRQTESVDLQLSQYSKTQVIHGSKDIDGNTIKAIGTKSEDGHTIISLNFETEEYKKKRNK